MRGRRVVIGLVALLLASGSDLWSRESEEAGWDVTLPRGETREIDFVIDEGTWISVDVSPDGQRLVFDLLGHIYQLPVNGGEAECLTEDSGIAMSYQPRYSPDGRSIAFISDRSGQDSLWVMDADGSNARHVFLDPTLRAAEPVWSADGDYILVTRRKTGLEYVPIDQGIWMYHREGGEGAPVVDVENAGVGGASVSKDGRYLYFHQSPVSGPLHSVEGHIQLWRVDLGTGERIELTVPPDERGRDRLTIAESYAPQVSPDGRWLAFARRIPDGTIEYRGHEFGPRTALWLRDLDSGSERVVLDPIEVDMAESLKRHWTRILPGYSWSPDGRSIFIAQGGKLTRLEVESGKVTTIPFTARVHRIMSETARASFRITDEPFEARFIRWPTSSPDGSRLAFQAAGKIWIVDLPRGEPRRLTPEAHLAFEYSPAWSPDGRFVAFTTWDAEKRGHLWKAPASGGEPVRLTEVAGEYIHPVWSPEGAEVVVVRGSGVTARGRSWTAHRWYELIAVPAAGGEARLVTRVLSPPGTLHRRGKRQIVRPSIGPESRIFYPEQKEEGGRVFLVSVRPDGTDKRDHLSFPQSDEIVISPDGKWVAFQEGDNVYLMPFPWPGTGRHPLHVEKRKGNFPVTPLSRRGGLFPRWRDEETVEFGSGKSYFVRRVASGSTEKVEVRLVLPRRIPKGSLAFTGARIVTARGGEVIDRGSIVVSGSRITCVGACSTEGVDRIIDASGETILPGFVDMHSHHYGSHLGVHPRKDFEQAIYLAYGVTTSLDNAPWSQNVFPMADLIDAGEVVGPRAFGTGDPLEGGPDDLRRNELTSYGVAEDNVMRLASWGATALKQYLIPGRAERQWIADVARRERLMLTAEGGHLTYNLSLILDGYTGWEHQLSQTPLYRDVTTFLGRANATYSPTFVVSGPAPWNIEYFWGESDVWKDEKLRRFLPWRDLFPRARRRMLRPPTDYAFGFVAEALADVLREGGYGAIGSHGEYYGLAPHWEIWMAATALGTLGALELATREGARFLGAEQDLGTLEAGKLADLLVLHSNPLEDIRNTLHIRYVMKGGVLWDAESLDEVWPEPKPFGDLFWVSPDALRQDRRPLRPPPESRR